MFEVCAEHAGSSAGVRQVWPAIEMVFLLSCERNRGSKRLIEPSKSEIGLYTQARHHRRLKGEGSAIVGVFNRQPVSDLRLILRFDETHRALRIADVQR